MPPDTQSFTFLIGLASSLLAQVMGRDGLTMRPVEVRPAVIDRLAAGVRVLASFVRRLLVLMALSFEHGLADRVMGPLPRPHGRRSVSGARFVVLEAPFALASEETPPKPAFNWADRVAHASAAPPARPVSPARLYQLLELLAAIVADPEPRARRLAFYLARRRHGPLLPPAGPARVAGCWGTEIRASHEAMAAAILSAGRIRPPPLPPPRRAGPVVTHF